MIQVMSKQDYQLFVSIAKASPEVLHKTMARYLRKQYGSKNVIINKDFILAKGDIPIALVAHMDTVFSKQPVNIYYDKEKTIMWSPEGLGADDRAGVFSICKIIQAGFRPHIVFTLGEEMGGIGAQACVIKYKHSPFKGLKYIIEFDRRGENDCVFYDLDNKTFEKYVESFGFETNWGTFTDICYLCPAWKVAGVNLSVGYEDEHHAIETLNTTFLYQTIDKVIKMLLDAENVKKPFKWVRCKEYDYYKKIATAYGLTWDDDEDDWFNRQSSPIEPVYRCAHCGKTYSETDIFPVKSKNGTGLVFYCGDCIGYGVDWCSECDEPFEKYDDGHICLNCKEKKEKMNNGSLLV